MNRILAGFALLLLPLTPLQAQPESATPAKEPVLSETHRFLAAYEGTWTEEVSIMPASGSDPEKFTLTTVTNMVMGGRFLQFSQTGEMHGSAFEGSTTLGYDKDSGIFTLCQITTESTKTLVLEGPWKDPGKSIFLKGTLNIEDKHSALLQQLITFEDKDNILIENYEPDEKGALFKSGEYRFSRQ